jgi:hypothetical protein
MPARPIFVLCEGQHDIAFLTRLLRASIGARPVKTTIASLPPPFAEFFLGRLKARDANDARVGGTGPISPDEPPLLEAIYEAADHSRWWYFMNCVGDGRTEQIKNFLEPWVVGARIEDPTKRVSEFGVVFVNDADENGIEDRRAAIAQSYGAFFEPILPNFANIAANTIQVTGGYGTGMCIFSEHGRDKGTLENIVWKLWAESHLSRRNQSHDLMKSLAVADTKIGPGSTPSKLLKAIITTAGQTESPGYSLAVVLRDTNALDAEALRADDLCGSYVRVLNEV